MRKGIAGALGLVTCVLAMAAHADYNGVDPYEEYGQRIHASESVSPLGDNVFGDSVSLYDGSTTFALTDVSLPGNNSLPVAVGRQLAIMDHRQDLGANQGAFDDWDLDIPYIVGTFTTESGWTMAPNGAANRCSDNVDVPYMYLPTYRVTAPYESVWDGNHLHIPGGSDEELLSNTQIKSPAYASRAPYPWVTKNNWKVSCLTSTANGYPGEAFVAISPSGVRYTFNWAATRASSTLAYQYDPRYRPMGVLRSKVYLLATQVQDRFGNTVTYAYDSNNHLTAITASDGRSITLVWSGSTVVSVTSALGTWSYHYAVGSDGGNHLNTVTRPDGSTWTYNVVSGSLVTTKNDWPDDSPPPRTHCQIDPDQNSGSFVYSVGAPSGAVGTFSFFYDRHLRDAVPWGCAASSDPNQNYPGSVTDYFDNFSLAQKQIAGPGLGTLTWTYVDDSDPAPPGYYTASAPYGWSYPQQEPLIPPGDCGCAVSKLVTVTGPTSFIKYSFGEQYARNEGQLLDIEVDAPTGTALKTTTNTYVSDNDAPNEPFANVAGLDLLPNYQNPMGNRNRPLISTQITQDGATFTTTSNSLDAFARSTSETASSSLGYSKTDTTAYSDDLNLWVLGLLTSSTTNGIVSSHIPAGQWQRIQHTRWSLAADGCDRQCPHHYLLRRTVAPAGQRDLRHCQRQRYAHRFGEAL